MLHNKRIYIQGLVTGLAVLFLLSLTTAYAIAQGNNLLRGVIRLSDRSLCYYSNTSFNKRVFPVLEYVSADGTFTHTLNATQIGLYHLSPAWTLNVGDKLRITCENLFLEHVLNQVDINTGQLDITLPNHRPIVTSLQARLGTAVVRAVPGGALITATVLATDPDGNPLHFEWRASDGIASNTNSSQVTWLLPNSRGLHFLYVLVSDGNGGYTEKQLALSTDGGIVYEFRTFLPIMLRGGAVVSPPPAFLLPSDHVPANDQFLAYSALTRFDLAPPYSEPDLGGPLDTRSSACAYYRDISAVGGCAADGTPTGTQLTFQTWKNRWGFGVSAQEASAKYANLADLNLQRDMHTVSASGPRPGGGSGTDVASYVCNYPNPVADTTLSNVRLGNNLVACVAFEYSVTNSPTSGLPYNGGQPFTKFLTFGPTGNLLLSVNLDGRGEKFIPGTCVACHGGNNYSGQYGLPWFDQPVSPALNAQFIPYDQDNYRFSTLVGFRQHDQESSFRALNQYVLETQPPAAIVELIQGWYPTPTSTFDGSFIPTGWAGHETLYNNVVKPACRMCHVVLDPNLNVDGTDASFSTYASFADLSSYIWRRVCGSRDDYTRYSYTMPNAKQTFDQFWTNTSPGIAPDADQSGTLLAFLMAESVTDDLNNPVTVCALPDWLP